MPGQHRDRRRSVVPLRNDQHRHLEVRCHRTVVPVLGVGPGQHVGDPVGNKEGDDVRHRHPAHPDQRHVLEADVRVGDPAKGRQHVGGFGQPAARPLLRALGLGLHDGTAAEHGGAHQPQGALLGLLLRVHRRDGALDPVQRIGREDGAVVKAFVQPLDVLERLGASVFVCFAQPGDRVDTVLEVIQPDLDRVGLRQQGRAGVTDLGKVRRHGRQIISDQLEFHALGRLGEQRHFDRRQAPLGLTLGLCRHRRNLLGARESRVTKLVSQPAQAGLDVVKARDAVDRLARRVGRNDHQQPDISDNIA